MLSANQMSVIKEQAYGGYASMLPEICEVSPITVGEMLEMGSDIYSTRLNLLLLTEENITEILEKKNIKVDENTDLSPLSYLMKNAAVSDAFFLELTAAFSTFIKKEAVLLLPKFKAVLVGPPEERRLITEQNFTDFQTILRLQNRKEVPKPPPENESAVARNMRLKAEYRDRIKRKQQQKNGEVQELADLLEIAEVFGIDYKNKSIYAFYGLIQRHQLREKWAQDLQMLCAGADSKQIKAKYWGSNSEN